MKKKISIIFLKIAISLFLVIFLYSRIDLAKVKSILFNINPIFMLLLFFILLINTFISSYKWQIILKADSINIPLKTLVASYLVGTFFNIFLPSNIGGDVYRVYDISQQGSRMVNSFASVFADRFSGFIALVTLGMLFPLLGYKLLPSHKFLIIPFITFLLLSLFLWSILQESLLLWFLRFTRLEKIKIVNEFIGRFLESIRAYKRYPSVMAAIMGISFVFQFIVICCIFTLSRALHIEAPFIYFCIFVPIISLMEALPISIYGIGVRDAAYVFFYGQAGISQSEAASMALLFLFTTITYALSGAVIFILKSLKIKTIL